MVSDFKLNRFDYQQPKKSIFLSKFYLKEKQKSPFNFIWKRIVRFQNYFFICNVMFDSVKLEFVFSFYSNANFRDFYFKINQQLMKIYFNLLFKRCEFWLILSHSSLSKTNSPQPKKKLFSPEFLDKFLKRGQWGKSRNYFWFQFHQKRFIWKEFFGFSFRNNRVNFNHQTTKILIFSKNSTKLCPSRALTKSFTELKSSTFIFVGYDYKRRKYAKCALRWAQILQMRRQFYWKVTRAGFVNGQFLKKLGGELAKCGLDNLKELVSSIFEKIR